MKLKATERRHCGFPGSPLLSHWLLQWLLSVSIGNILNLHTSSFFFFLILGSQYFSLCGSFLIFFFTTAKEVFL